MDTEIDRAAALAQRLDAMLDGSYLKYGRNQVVWDTFDAGLDELGDLVLDLDAAGVLSQQLLDQCRELHAWRSDIARRHLAMVERNGEMWIERIIARHDPTFAASLNERAEAQQADEDDQDARKEAAYAKVDANQEIARKLEADPRFHIAMRRQRERDLALIARDRRTRTVDRFRRPRSARTRRVTRLSAVTRHGAARAPSRQDDERPRLARLADALLRFLRGTA